MVNLKSVSSPEQVYSEELNEILIKTPPRLFKLAILMFTACVLAALLGGFFVRYEKSKHYDYILYRGEKGVNTLVIFSEENIADRLEGNVLKLYPGAAASHGEGLSFRADSVSKEEIYRVNNAYSALGSKEVETLPEIRSLDVHYKYYLYASDTALAVNFDEYRVGVLYLPMGKQRLFRLFTGS